MKTLFLSKLWMLGLMIIMGGAVSYSLSRKHLLMVLLSLEYMVLGVFLLLMISVMIYESEYYVLLVYLTFTVCEGVLGLSILVSMIRTHGSDYFSVYNVLSC
uniref:NADH-ubiquinone oxidoreductase chain 4L n=1 Tax=Nallachius americanus TaxID=560880 RepID=A0A1S5QY39_9NEOP|nr:NADH dehydrogenase subunit 4L [Nallachius americanus]